MSEQIKPVKMKIVPYANFTKSKNYCGACGTRVPDNVDYCPGCGVPIYGRAGEGSYSKCKACGAYIPNGKGLEKCPNCREPIS